MTANELADGIESCTTDPLHKQAATMLRQQQAEIELLKSKLNADKFCDANCVWTDHHPDHHPDCQIGKAQ